jgi:hypothetical protein
MVQVVIAALVFPYMLFSGGGSVGHVSLDSGDDKLKDVFFGGKPW